MAPPTPVIHKDELQRVFQLDERVDTEDCVLKSLTQHNCVFEGGLVNCVPFKRMFKDCALKSQKGQKVQKELRSRITIEITDINTNREASEATLFLRAQHKLRKQALREEGD